MNLRRLILLLVCAAAIASPIALHARTAESKAPGRIFILMVWDGLRPDLVAQQTTPNLFAMARDGVRFDRHHSLYPTLTLVNAAALATGAPPGLDEWLGNVMFFKPALKPPPDSELARLISQPVQWENAKLLAELNGPDGFAGHLLGLDTVVQEIQREGGYTAVLGKNGPTFMFDDRVASVKNGRDILNMPHADFLFATDDLVAPQSAAAPIEKEIKAAAADRPGFSARDALYARLATERAIPAARAASNQGRPAMIVLWMREPDWAQHRAGLGTAEDFQALAESDSNLGKVRKAIDDAGIAARTDLMVVSDHGFATMRLNVDLNGLLVAAGLKKAVDSTDMVIARDGGSDFIYLSRTDFPTAEARRDILQRIVNFAEAQEWCGPIFSRRAAPNPAPARRRRSRTANDYLGWIDGTFNQAAIGIYDQTRSPDLVISFREYPDLDNAKLTGPGNLAFVLDAKGQRAVANRSGAVVRSVKGLLYADVKGRLEWTSGMGMHGAAGMRELHNFCAAIGPDFKRHLVDRDPTGNADVAPTVAKLLDLQPNVGPGGRYATGRPMQEALREGRAPGVPHPTRMTANLELQGERVITTLSATTLARWTYLDDSSVEHVPLGHSP